MRLDQSVDVPADVKAVWDLLGDIPAVAGCMPGAQLTGTVDESTYEGAVTVAIGPLAMNYTGTVTIQERDEDARTIVLLASGRDRRGAGTAKAHVTVSLEPADEHTRLRVGSDLQLTGRIAALGRGVDDVANRLFTEFADRLAARVGTGESTPVPASAPSDASLRVGSLVWSVVRQRLGNFLVRLGERVRS